MSDRYLRNKRDGTIYDWHPILAANPLCEEVTEQEAFPERFLKPEVVEAVVEKRKTRKRKALDLNTDDIPDPIQVLSEELNQEASRGLP
jgi:hypothetical protein